MVPRKKLFVVLGFILLGLFVIFSLAEEFGSFNYLDPLLTQTSQSLIPRSMDAPLSIFSIFGSIEITTLVLVIIALIIIGKEKLIPYSLGVFALIMVIELIAKFFIYHPSPPQEFFRYSLPFATPHYISSTFSFPSGHVARTTFLVLIGIILINKYIKDKKIRLGIDIFLIVFLIIMSVSRIYLGEHWTSDVLGGLLLGSAFGFLAMVYY